MRPRLPAPTIRLRLTLVYGGLFTLSAAALLAITFVLVNHQYTGNFFISSGQQGVVASQGVGNLTVGPVPPRKRSVPASSIAWRRPTNTWTSPANWPSKWPRTRRWRCARRCG